MNKKTRLGYDPFAEKDKEGLPWVKDTSEKRKTKKKSKQGLQSKPDRPATSAKVGLRDGWIRATFIVREDNLEKVKAAAYWDRKEIKEVVDEALTNYFKDKRIKPMPIKENR